jgi:UDP-N-acetylglucosamine--N-acetylmuramyl-(pentapeptide) pyrophosphoryl-undecaprenol N-acetylglucosamine transferase
VPDAQVAFVGTAAGLEARVIPREGFPLDVIRSAGLKGKAVGPLIRGLGLLPLSAVDAWNVVTRRRPAVVIGVGGYSSGPVVLIAALRGIPALLIEQNAMPGLTNRLLARVVDAAAITYEESARFFRSKAFISGNPVRPEFFQNEGAYGHHGDESSRGRDGDSAGSPSRTARVLVFGGSQGAHAINVAMVEAAPRLAAEPRVAITHQTGERDLEVVRDGYRRAGLEARVEPFLFAMDSEMKAADLVVCRAGATTIAELTAAGRAAILVPLPTATDDHQRKNALALVRQGAAHMLDQRELSGDRLAAEIVAFAENADERRQVGEAARRLARPDAARVIVDRVLALAGDAT